MCGIVLVVAIFARDADARLEPERAAEHDLSFAGIRKVRVYWNVGSAAPWFWSFDFGDSSTEHYIRRFESEVPMHTAQTGKRESWPNPSGWLEGEGYVSVREGVLRLTKRPALELVA